MFHGIINIYKEKGYTSHDVVAVLRRVLNQKKIGHTGTLDPDATGVLPVCLGRGTKVAGMLTDKDKAYRTTFVLGVETDTQDHTGEILEEKPWQHVTEESVLQTIKSFIGDLEQVPPMYSAIKVNGRKLYDLAREGKTIERKTRPVTILDISDVSVDLPEITMTVSCSKGTYIRTLCRDIAEALGTCGHMKVLERIKSGPFEVETALTLDRVKELAEAGGVGPVITQVADMFPDYRPVVIGGAFDKLLVNGNKMPRESFDLTEEPVDDERFNVYNEIGDYMGIYYWSGNQKLLIPVTFFNIPKDSNIG